MCEVNSQQPPCRNYALKLRKIVLIHHSIQIEVTDKFRRIFREKTLGKAVGQTMESIDPSIERER